MRGQISCAHTGFARGTELEGNTDMPTLLKVGWQLLLVNQVVNNHTRAALDCVAVRQDHGVRPHLSRRRART